MAVTMFPVMPSPPAAEFIEVLDRAPCSSSGVTGSKESVRSINGGSVDWREGVFHWREREQSEVCHTFPGR